MPPQSPEYARLLREKMRLERLLANGGWGALVPGGRLETGDSGAAVVALRDRLVPMATVLTPNLPEAADLLDAVEATDWPEMAAQAAALRAMGPAAVLLKGGHLAGPDSPDLLMTDDGAQRLDAPRHATRNTHGTGCTLSSALAAQLGHGHVVPEAARRAKAYIAASIAAADTLTVGSGHGPVHHFHAMPVPKETTP